jgi:hypothetical protein
MDLNYCVLVASDAVVSSAGVVVAISDVEEAVSTSTVSLAIEASDAVVSSTEVVVAISSVEEAVSTSTVSLATEALVVASGVVTVVTLGSDAVVVALIVVDEASASTSGEVVDAVVDAMVVDEAIAAAFSRNSFNLFKRAAALSAILLATFF